MEQPFDPSLCPSCGKRNGCSMAANQGDIEKAESCWCTNSPMNDTQRKALKERFPDPQCLCPNCLSAWKASK